MLMVQREGEAQPPTPATTQKLRPLFHLDHLVCHEAVRLTVDGSSGFGTGSVDQAVHSPFGHIEPVF